MKFAMVVGASRGLGAELVKQLADSGYRVAAISRNKAELDQLVSHCPAQILPFVRDASDVENIERDFKNICFELGGLDLIVYNAGVMPLVEKDEFSIPKDLDMISVNCAGAVMWLDLSAERFQSTKRGCIIGIGSVAGDRGRQGQPVYNASKAFLHTYLEALRNRLSKLGVSVVTIKPGPLRTAMTAHMDHSKFMAPEVAAAKIIRKIGKNGEFYLSPVHLVIFTVIRLIPGFLMRRLPL